jgi:aconitate hydratase
VVARSFERIHRANLVGMGVLPLELPAGVTSATLGLDGTERYDVLGLEERIAPRAPATLRVRRGSGEVLEVPLLVRVDTPIEAEYLGHGGILPFVLRQVLRGA